MTASELATQVITTLARQGLSLATCESLTGGLIAAEVTAVAGASAVFRGGLITYASDLKASLAGVDEVAIATHGVINQSTAEQMAVGARSRCGADLGVGITGVAGPDTQDGQPVGTVWLAVAAAGGVQSRRLEFSGDRHQIRQQSVVAALQAVLDLV